MCGNVAPTLYNTAQLLSQTRSRFEPPSRKMVFLSLMDAQVSCCLSESSPAPLTKLGLVIKRQRAQCVFYRCASNSPRLSLRWESSGCMQDPQQEPLVWQATTRGNWTPSVRPVTQTTHALPTAVMRGACCSRQWPTRQLHALQTTDRPSGDRFKTRRHQTHVHWRGEGRPRVFCQQQRGLSSAAMSHLT